MLKDFRKKLNGKLGLAAVLFGCVLFVVLSVLTTLLLYVLWPLIKESHPVGYLFVPVIILQIPGWLIDAFVQTNFWMRTPWAKPDLTLLIVSFYSSVFWSVVAYGLLKFERWWDSREK